MKCRAIIEGKEVIGWYVPNSISHFIVPIPAKILCGNNELGPFVEISNGIEIDPATTAVATGKKDKNKKEIFGSKTVDGVEFGGGDEVKAAGAVPLIVKWSVIDLQWRLGSHMALGRFHSKQLEIIPKEKENGCPCGSGTMLGTCPECGNET